MRMATPVHLTDEQRAVLQRWARGRSIPYRLVLRARIVLEAAAGHSNRTIAERLDTDPHTVGRWRQRFLANGLDGLMRDAPRPGRRRDDDLRRRIAAALATPKDDRQSARALARVLGVSASTVLRIAREAAVDEGAKLAAPVGAGSPNTTSPLLSIPAEAAALPTPST
jgi:transposase